MVEKVYHIGFRIASGAPDPEKLARAMDQVGNWIRINVYIWYVHTSLSSSQIYSQLRTTITNADSLVVIAVDPADFNGWAPKWVWDWFAAKNQAKRIGAIGSPTQGIGLGRSKF